MDEQNDAICLALFDDEPLITKATRDYVEATRGTGTSVLVFPRPRRLDTLSIVPAFSHAVVDLSFGPRDIDAPDRPEPECGVDAIDRLVADHPACRILVATRLDTALIGEMAKAIRQTWPAIPFANKLDGLLLDRLDRFLDNAEVRDNVLFQVALRDAKPLPASRIRRGLEACIYPGTGLSLLLHLADQAEQPSGRELATALSYSESYIRRLLLEVGIGLHGEGFLGKDEKFGIERLWLWARARGAILRREFSKERLQK